MAEEEASYLCTITVNVNETREGCKTQLHSCSLCSDILSGTSGQKTQNKRQTNPKQLGVLAKAGNPSTGEVDTEGSEVEGHRWLLSIEFKASLGYMRPCFEMKNTTYSLL